MAIIYTRDGDEITVDDADYLPLTQYSWHLDGHGYAVRSNYLGFVNGKKDYRQIHMARQLVGLDSTDARLVDYINGDILNNHRSNLRIVSIQENNMNRGKHTRSASRFKGVTWHKKCKKWQVMCRGKYLGLFSTEGEAAKAYQAYAESVFGEFARKAVA